MGSLPIGLSASRGSAILGLSKWSTPFTVWQKIMEARKPGFNAARGYIMPIFEESAQIRWGKAFEDAVIKLSEEARDEQIVAREEFASVPGHDYITCHIDGRYVAVKNINHEGKTTSFFYYKDNFGEPGTDKIPQDYGVQTQHQMACTGADEVILSVLVFPRRVDDWEADGWEVIDHGLRGWKLLDKEGEPYDTMDWANPLCWMGYFHQYTIKRNQELIDLMIEKYTAFWNDHVLTGKEPVPKDYDDIKRLCPAPVGTIVATAQLERWATEYKEIGEELGTNGTLTKRRTQLKVLILDKMRKMDNVIDDDSRDKTILRNTRSHNLLSFSGKVLR